MTPSPLLSPSPRPSALHRHQLLRLSPAGWAHVLSGAWDPGARRCLALWAERGHPLVVTRQTESAPTGFIAAGLPAPTRYGRRRFTLAVPRSEVLRFDEFFAGPRVTRHLPPAARGPWGDLAKALADVDCRPRVYGGHGWQAMTGLRYVHPRSDLDLLLPVPDRSGADAVCGVLSASSIARPRLDGELVFANGAAVAWREWLAVRQGQTDRVLVKRLHGIALERPDDLDAPGEAGAAGAPGAEGSAREPSRP